jgi:Reverse transcriptase (RNA-dependent DNA polymerase)
MVQAARQWWKRVNAFMKKLGFFPSPDDTCLFVKIVTNDDHPAFIIIYVDDGLIIGTPALIKTVLQTLSKKIKTKIWEPLKNLLVVKFI